MKTNYTHIAMVIDRSGSMSTVWTEVLGGYKKIIEDNKALDGECTLTVAAFDDSYETIVDFENIQNVSETLNVSPRGWTALLDAVGKTITTLGAKLESMPEGDRPEKVLVIIQTDGYENASSEFTNDAIKNMIKEQTEKYNWQFQFLGATLESIASAESWGLDKGRTVLYNASAKSGETFSMLAEKTRQARSASVADFASATLYSSEEIEKLS